MRRLIQQQFSFQGMNAVLVALLMFLGHFNDAPAEVNKRSHDSVVDLATESQFHSGPANKRIDSHRISLLVSFEFGLPHVPEGAVVFQHFGFSPGRMVLEGSGSAQSPPATV